MRLRPLAVVLAGLLLLPACDPHPGGDGQPTRLEVGRADRVGARPPERPTSVRLPSGTTVPVRPVDARSRGLLAVPADVHRAGWWRGGSRIGDPFGATLLAGHVDSVTQGLGPFAELLTVQAGDRIVVRTAHLRQAFEVRALRLFPPSLRRRPWVWAVAGTRRLVLVTCAPPYDPGRGGYQRLAVVTARPVGAPS